MCDGQQRLTTLLLILAVLRDVSIDRNKLLADTCANAIFQEKTSLKSPGRIRIKFDVEMKLEFHKQARKMP